MGTMTDANIAIWQQKAGIEPAKAGAAKRLCELSREAYELIRIIELERSGMAQHCRGTERPDSRHNGPRALFRGSHDRRPAPAELGRGVIYRSRTALATLYTAASAVQGPHSAILALGWPRGRAPVHS